MNNFWINFKKPIVALSPMAGITDSAFRQVCKKQGADVLYSEMVSVDALYYDNKKTLEMLKFDLKKEKYLVVQLFGKDPEKFIKAAKMVEKLGAHGIDINFGCPARKVVAHGGGVTLMRDLDLCYEIIKNTIKAVDLPVSVKIRAGINFKSKKITAVDFIEKIEDLDVKSVMIHGRTYEQGFSGQVDYQMINKVKQLFKGVVLANGGINTPEDAQIMLKKTGADGIGLARGILGKPWLFKQIDDFLQKGKYKELTFKQVKKIILEHSKLNYQHKGKKGMFEMRKHLGWYIKGFEGAKDLRNQLMKVEKVSEIKKILEI